VLVQQYTLIMAANELSTGMRDERFFPWAQSYRLLTPLTLAVLILDHDELHTRSLFSPSIWWMVSSHQFPPKPTLVVNILYTCWPTKWRQFTIFSHRYSQRCESPLLVTPISQHDQNLLENCSI